MFCKAKHKGEGLLPFYRIIYRIAALRGVALVILGRCHKVTEGLKKIIWMDTAVLTAVRDDVDGDELQG